MQDKAQAAASGTNTTVTADSKQWLAPKSLSELFNIVEECNSQDSSFRLIAGNTGAGVYHDWPLEQVLVDIKGIPDLNGITVTKVWDPCRAAVLLACMRHSNPSYNSQVVCTVTGFLNRCWIISGVLLTLTFSNTSLHAVSTHGSLSCCSDQKHSDIIHASKNHCCYDLC